MTANNFDAAGERTAILGIDTSCDDTAAAVVVNGRLMLSCVVGSQIEVHEEFGGVVPEIASRRHVEAIVGVVDEALRKANIDVSDVDAVAATYGPGLVGALLVGLSAAKGVAYAVSKPFIAVNHIEAHICANYIAYPKLSPPFTALVASGGHSSIYYVDPEGAYVSQGRTRDDAAGEAFDKVARAGGLGYPGGAKIDAAAAGGDPFAVKLPIARLKDGSLDFSFSGVKTAAVNELERQRRRKKGGELSREYMRDFWASFRRAIVDALVANVIGAEDQNRSGKIALAGGVAANAELRGRLAQEAKERGIEVFAPPPFLCTDNAAMVASAAYWAYGARRFSSLGRNAEPSAPL